MPKFGVFVQRRLAREADGKASTRIRKMYSSKKDEPSVPGKTVVAEIVEDERREAAARAPYQETNKEERDLVSESTTSIESISQTDQQQEETTNMTMMYEEKAPPSKEWAASEKITVKVNDGIVYPDWTKSSFEPWSQDDGDLIDDAEEEEDDDGEEELNVQETESFGQSQEEDEEEEEEEIAILRSKDDDDVQDDTSVVSSAASVDSETSEIKSLENLWKVFQCEPQASYASKDEDDEQKKLTSTMAETNEQPTCAGVHDVGSLHGSIYSAFSSPSRRSHRTWKSPGKSRDGSGQDAIDSVIEMSPTNENSSKEEMVRSQKETPPGFLSVPPIEARGPNDYLNHTTIQREILPVLVAASNASIPSHPGRQLVSIPWSSRKRLIVTDKETSLPDNLPPMARLRYCNAIGGRESLLVARERCYV
jgi:hypothetical protein